jgi:hypothetical protein
MNVVLQTAIVALLVVVFLAFVAILLRLRTVVERLERIEDTLSQPIEFPAPQTLTVDDEPAVLLSDFTARARGNYNARPRTPGGHNA